MNTTVIDMTPEFKTNSEYREHMLEEENSNLRKKNRELELENGILYNRLIDEIRKRNDALEKQLETMKEYMKLLKNKVSGL